MTQPDQSPSSRRPDLEVSEVTGSGTSGGFDVDRLNLRMAASRLYRELRWTGTDHLAAKGEVERTVAEVCRG